MKNFRLFVTLFILFAIGLALYGCGNATGGGGGGGGGTPTSSTGMIWGKLYNWDGSAFPVTDTAVVTCGALSVNVSTTGYFLFSSLPAGTYSIIINGDGPSTVYPQTIKTITLPAAGNYYFETFMKGFTKVTLQTGEGEVVDGSLSGRLILAHGVTFEYDNGSPYSGTVEAYFSYCDPTSTTEVTRFPGAFEGKVNGITKPIESFGFCFLNLTDDAGNHIKLSGGSTAEVRMTVPASLKPAPATIPLWTFNETDKIWEIAGEATLEIGGNYYVAILTHFSSWNVDRVYETCTLTGSVKYANSTPVSGAVVKARGISYAGDTRALTDTNGNFSLLVKELSTVEVSALRGQNASTPETVNSPAAGSTLNIGDIIISGTVEGLSTISVDYNTAVGYLNAHLTGPTTSDAVRFHLDTYNFISSEPEGSDCKTIASFGPDIIGIYSWHPGTYRLCIENDPSTQAIDPAVSGKVTFNNGGVNYVYNMPASNPNNYTVWKVLEVTVNLSGEVTNINEFNSFVTGEPSPF